MSKIKDILVEYDAMISGVYDNLVNNYEQSLDFHLDVLVDTIRRNGVAQVKMLESIAQLSDKPLALDKHQSEEILELKQQQP